MKRKLVNKIISVILSALIMVGTLSTSMIEIEARDQNIEAFQRLVVEEGKKLVGKVTYDTKFLTSGSTWRDASGGKATYSTAQMHIECNAFVRRVLVNSFIKSKEKKIALDKSYEQLLRIDPDGLQLRQILTTIQNATGTKMVNAPRNIQNSNYQPVKANVDKFMDQFGPGSVVYFEKYTGKSDGLHWGIYMGKEYGKHMVLHNTSSGKGGAVYEEMTGMWFGKGSGYKFVSVYNALPPLPELGRIEIEKVNQNGVGIQNVKFDLYKSDKKTIVKKDITTNYKGIAVHEMLLEGTYYAKETSVPSPYIFNKDTWYRFDVKAGETAKVSNSTGKITNSVADGIITINKNSEEGNPYPGVKFSIKNNNGTVVDTVTTNTNGVATSKRLSLGNYTVTEIEAPNELNLDKTPKKVTLSYKDQNTALVYGSVKVTNTFKPVIDFGVEKIRIDTQKASQGLVVNTWFNLKENYNFNLNNFKDTVVKISLIDKSSNKAVDSKSILVKNLKDNYQFNIGSKNLGKNSYSNYEILIEADKDKVNITQAKLSTEGYTATENQIQKHVDYQKDFNFKEVIRTERTYGQNMIKYYEHFNFSVDPIQPLRTGRGFTYDIKTEYRNDLKNTANVEFVFNPNKALVDKDYSKIVDMKNPQFKLENKAGVHTLPHIYSEVRTGEIITENEYNKLSSEKKKRYFDGGNQLLTPIWSTDLGKYNTQLQSNEIGVNAVKYTVNDHAELFAFMFGWYDENGPSPSHEMDGIVAAPVLAHNPFPNGIPDNWGFTLQNGNKVLTAKEQEFFGQNQKMAVRYMIDDNTEFTQSQQVEKGASITVTNKIPKKDGHRFMGWKLDSSDFKAGDKAQAITDLNFFAQWEQGRFTATFNTDGGSSIDPVDFNYGDVLKAPVTPTKEGHDFVKWNYNFASPLFTDTTIKAEWRVKPITIKLNTDGGTKLPDIQTTWGSKITMTSVPTKEGFVFDGWNFDFDKPFYTDTTIKALWVNAYHNVSFDTDGGNKLDSQSIAHGSKVLLPVDPVKDGYVFKGWDGNINSVITSDTRFTALWDQIQYTVSFDTKGGNSLPKQVLNHNDLIQSVSDPVKTGYDFVGWDYDFNTPITENILVTAEWVVQQYMVEFDAGEDVVIPFQLVSFGEKAKLPTEVPEKEGFEFGGWDYDFTKPITLDTRIQVLWNTPALTIFTVDTLLGSTYVPVGTKLLEAYAIKGNYADHKHNINDEVPKDAISIGKINYLSDLSIIPNLPINGEYSIIVVGKIDSLTGNRKTNYGLIDVPKFNSVLSGTKSMNYAFMSAINFEGNSINHWNVTEVESMEYMFHKASSFNQEVNFDAPNLLTVANMFSEARSFNSPVSIKSPKLNKSYYMFHQATSFNQPLNLDTSEVIDMANMFGQATAFNQAVNFDTSSVTDMNHMFDRAPAFNHPINFDTSNVTNMSNMFSGAREFNQQVNFDTSNVTNMSEMFAYAYNFDKPISLNTSNVESMKSMFKNARSYNQAVNFDTSKVTNMSGMFEHAWEFNQPVNFDTSSVTDMNLMFRSAYKFNQPIKFNSRFVTNMSDMFDSAYAFNKEVKLDTSNVTDISRMFAYASKFNQRLDFDTSKVVNMYHMFGGARAYNQPTNFDTANVTNMNTMFYGALSFNRDISNWNVDKVTNWTNFSYNSLLTENNMPNKFK